jgi:hypothetical protein
MSEDPRCCGTGTCIINQEGVCWCGQTWDGEKMCMPKSMTTQTSFKGNKQSLPSKPCQVCGREMTWRKSWAKNWQDVKYCSEACRKSKNIDHTR